MAYQKLMVDNPEYQTTVDDFPKKMYSGKKSATLQGVFFCYELPMLRADGSWSNGDGLYKWYILYPETGKVIENTYEVWKAIECLPTEPRVMTLSDDDFEKNRKQMDSYLRNNYLKQVQAPMGIKPRLVTWMQLG